jgi:hypothetical protein
VKLLASGNETQIFRWLSREARLPACCCARLCAHFFLLSLRKSQPMSDEDYEPEYELERFTIDGRLSVEVLAVVPPPLEYMSSLHSQKQEISGRQVWCGSLLLASVLANLDTAYMNDKR